jgi:hypothetical protein
VAVAASAVAVLALVQARLAAVPIEPFGQGAGHYAEHANRTALAILVHCQFGGEPADLVDAFDGAFPPLVHLVGLATSALLGPRAADVAPMGALWLFILAGGVGATTARLAADRRVGLLAAGMTILLPALHATSTRYYFDLPMTALLWWIPVPLLGARRNPVRAGLAAGLLFAAACLAKWTAVPFGAAMALGAVLCIRRRPRRRPGAASGSDGEVRPPTAPLGPWLALLLTGLVAWGLLSGFLRLAGPESSLIGMAEEAAAHNPQPTGVLGGVAERGPVARLAVQAIEATTRFDPERALFYAVATPASLLSPLLALLLVVPLLVWLKRDREGLPLVAVVLLAHAAFGLLVMEILDERFMLSALPVAAVIAACGLRWMSPRLRFFWGAAALLVALWVAWDFHLVPTPQLTPRIEVVEVAPPRWPLAFRGVGLASSVQHRGWARRDAAVDDRPALRRALWRQVEACGPEVIGVQQHQPLVLADGDGDWLRYEGALQELATCAPSPAVVVLGQTDPGEPAPDLLLVSDEGAVRLVGRGWQEAARVADPAGGPGVVLLRRYGSRLCEAAAQAPR